MSKYFLFILVLAGSINAAYGQNTIQPKQVYSSDFVIDEIPRNISFYIPVKYGSTDFYPLLVMLHPENENSIKFIKDYGDTIQSRADSLNCVILYPDALKGKWYTGIDTNEDSVNDVGFLSIMITYFIQQYSCNPNNIFICGFGQGANMAEKLACKLNIPVNAVAAFKTGNDSSFACVPPASVAVIDTKYFLPDAGKLPYKNAVKEVFGFIETKLKK